MRHGDISDSLYCLGAACASDLPDIEYDSRGPRDTATVKKTRRPWDGDCEVYSFPQTWGHGSMVFGGMGTASYETAQVTVVYSGIRTAAVYCGRRLAYVLTLNDRQPLIDDIRAWRIVDCKDAGKYGEVLKYGTSYVPREKP